MIDVHDRLTERINRARLKLEVKRAAVPLVVVLIGAALGLAAWGIQVSQIAKYVLRDSRELRFAVNDASAVVPKRQEVRFKGIPAGTITDVKMEHAQPVITVKLYKSFGPVYRDLHATLRPNTALEDMYLDILDRGHKSAGEATKDTVIPARQTDTSVQLEEVLNVFQPNVRTRLGALMRDLGGGLDRRGDDLREAFVKLVPFLHVATRLTDQLAERSGKTRRLVHDFSVLSRELARRRIELRDLIGDGGRTLQSVAEASPSLDATLRELPPTLGELDTSLTALHAALPDVDKALRALGPTAQRLPEGLSALRRLSDSADPAVRALREPVKRLVPLARYAKPFTRNLDQALAAMRPQGADLDYMSKSLGPCVYPALYGFFQWDVSLGKFGDARGAAPRGDAMFGFGTNPALRDPLIQPQRGCAPGMPKLGEP